jgi:hydrogenase nickel incorporation protein HypA/HybF
VHEASAAEAIVRIVSAEAAARNAARISRISLVMGEATGYMRESLEFYLAATAKGSPAEGAALDIRYLKTLLRCPSCGIQFERGSFAFECPACGTRGLMIGAGSEFYVDSIEIEEASI